MTPHRARFGRLAAWVVGVAAALAGAAPVRAQPVVRGLQATPAGGTKLAVEFETALERRGRVTVQATLDAASLKARPRPLRVRRSVAAGTRTVRFVLDARRARVRGATGPVTFTITATATERGAPAATQSISAVLPVPLVILPGLGNETTPGSFDAFALALDGAAGGVYRAGTDRPALLVHGYDSTLPLGALAADLDREVKALLRRSVFARVDVVGYSMGGLVARQWLAGAGAGRVRKLVFLGTPNEGAPIAFVVSFAAQSGSLETLVGGAAGGALGDVADAFLTEDAIASIGLFYPTYDWATLRLFPLFPPARIPSATLEQTLQLTDTQLDELNALAPDAEAELHAFFYSSVPTETFGLPLGTMDEVDLTGLFAGGTLDFTNVQDLASLASGSGDGVVPARSVRMDDVAAWKSRITAHDLGAGTHVTFALDPNVYAGVAQVLAQ